ncbi:MAG: TIGR03761 family integrating conjugative element protein [Betaproteobacteria bacterium]|nr:TIGR03761 family integrating conjugative element protein [Betaproteobacteria bacterium]
MNEHNPVAMDLAKMTVETPRHSLPALGELVDEAPDTMVLHTREAYRLFVGRSLDAGSPRAAIVGGRRVAAALRAIWHLSGNDNPYADWVLVNIGERLIEIGSSLQRETQRGEGQLRALQQRGLHFSVLQSRVPQRVELGFRSPYGYAVADLVVRFDTCNRVLKTLVRKDLLPDRDGRTLIYSYTRRLRGLFEEPVRFERWLMRDVNRPLLSRPRLPPCSRGGGQQARAGGPGAVRSGAARRVHRHPRAAAQPAAGRVHRAGAPAAAGRRPERVPCGRRRR